MPVERQHFHLYETKTTMDSYNAKQTEEITIFFISKTTNFFVPRKCIYFFTNAFASLSTLLRGDIVNPSRIN